MIFFSRHLSAYCEKTREVFVVKIIGDDGERPRNGKSHIRAGSKAKTRVPAKRQRKARWTASMHLSRKGTEGASASF